MLFCLNSSVLAYDIYLRTSDIATELKIDVPFKYIEKIEKNKNDILFRFNKDIKMNVGDNFEKGHIKKITFSNNILKIVLSNSSNYFIRKFSDSVIITITPSSKITDVYVSNNIEKPLINKGNNIEKNPIAEKQLAEINNLLKEGKTKDALNKTKAMLNEYVSGYYASEALFRLGLIYMQMGKKSDKYYLEASFVFDNFIKEFPDNFRMVDALWKSAEAKEKAGIYYEAIFAYKKVLNVVPDTETGKQALANIANIYYKIGQFDKAIETYKQYMKRYKDRPVEILAKLGLVYFKMKDYESAFLYFNEVADKGIDYLNFDTEILLAMAQSFETKNRNKEAIEIYNKIYNLYPDSNGADIAMYKSGILLEKEGKKNLAKQLLMECKEKYRGKKGALMAALHLAQNDMKNFSSEYWRNFLADVLENDIDINLKIEAHYFIIKSYFREERYNVCLQLIAEFEKNFFDSPILGKVYDLKQQIYMKQANAAFLSAQLDKADEIANKLLSEFPDSKYRDNAKKLLEKTKFYRIKKLFDKKQYLKAITEIENFYINSKRIYEQDKWTGLLDDAYVAHMKELESAGDIKSEMLYARQYLIQIPKGKKYNEIHEKLVKYVNKKIIKYVMNRSYIKAIQIFERDKSWLEKSKNKKYFETAKSYVAFALYKLGEKKSSAKLVKTIKDKNEPKISMLMLLLDLKNKNFDINKLSDEDFKFAIEELKLKNIDEALKYANKYKKNDKLKYELIYDIISSTDGNKHLKLLENFYKEISNKSDEIKSSVKKVFFDIGLQYYQLKKYSESAKALNEFVKLANKDTEEFVKSIYFLGMVNLKLKNYVTAKEFFNRLIKNFPDSEYAEEAKSELKDLEWKEKTTK